MVFLITSSCSLSLDSSVHLNFAFTPFLSFETGVLDICFFETDKLRVLGSFGDKKDSNTLLKDIYK